MIYRHLMAGCMVAGAKFTKNWGNSTTFFPGPCIHLLVPRFGHPWLPFPSFNLGPITNTVLFQIKSLNCEDCHGQRKRESVNVEFERNGEIGDLVIPPGRFESLDSPASNAPKDGCLPFELFTINRGRQSIRGSRGCLLAFVVPIICLTNGSHCQSGIGNLRIGMLNH